MGSILVGIDGSDRGRRALDWAVRFARVVGYDVHMLAVIDEAIDNKAGVGVETITDTVTAALEKKRQAALESYPDMRIQASVSVGDIVGVLADSAAMHDLIVLGSHHGHTIGETISGAKGLRVSVSTSVPTVVVPADGDAKQQGTGTAVGAASSRAGRRSEHPDLHGERGRGSLCCRDPLGRQPERSENAEQLDLHRAEGRYGAQDSGQRPVTQAE